MVESDSLEFFAKYKGWIAINKINVDESTKPIEVAEYLSSVRHAIDRKAFEVVGIDADALDSYSKKITKGLSNTNTDIIAAYKRSSSAESKREVEKAARETDELKPFAQAYLLRCVLKELDVDFCLDTNKQAIFGHRLSPEERARGARQYSGLQGHSIAVPKQSASKNASMPNGQADSVYFIAKYKNWVSIKKMNIRENTKPAEIAAHLGSIRMAVDRKEFEFVGLDVALLDAYAESATGKTRKSVANFGNALELLDSEVARSKIIDASKGNEKLREVARIYLFSKFMQNMKFDLELNPETVAKMYPELQIPKPRGRMPGQKKKKQ